MAKARTILQSQVDVLETATQIQVAQGSTTAVSLLNPSVKDEYERRLGGIISGRAYAAAIEFSTLQQLAELLTNQKYKTLNLPSQKALFEYIGIPEGTGKKIAQLVNEFGEKGFLALKRAGMRSKDFNMLKKIKAEFQPGETNEDEGVIIIGEEKVEATPENKEVIQNLIKTLHKEKAALVKQVEETQTEIKKIQEKNQKLKDKLVDKQLAEQETPEVREQKKCQEIMNRFHDDIQYLKGLMNSEHKQTAGATSVYMDALIQELLQHVEISDHDYEGIKTPEDIIDNFGE